MEILKRLEGKTLYLTGGTGFFGKAIVRYLSSLEWNIPPTVILNSRGIKKFDLFSPCSLKIKSDIKNSSSVDFGLFPRIDFVIHAATSTDVEAENIHYLEDSKKGLLNILEQCRIFSPEAFLYVSSGAVYGMNRKDHAPLEEGFPLGPDSSYGENKKQEEELVESFHFITKTPALSARCFAFSGPDLDYARPYAVTSFIKQAILNKKIEISGNGTAVRSYLDQVDLSRWLLTLLLKNTSHDIVNVGSHEGISTLALATKISKLTGIGNPILLNRPDVRDNFYVPVTEKAQKKYGLISEISLEKSLALMIQEFPL